MRDFFFVVLFSLLRSGISILLPLQIEPSPVSGRGGKQGQMVVVSEPLEKRQDRIQQSGGGFGRMNSKLKRAQLNKRFDKMRYLCYNKIIALNKYKR